MFAAQGQWGRDQDNRMRTVESLLSGIPESSIRIVLPDISGAFGYKVGARPGQVCATVASVVTGRPVKWIEDRMDKMMAKACARDCWMQSKIAGLWCHTTADNGALDAGAGPGKFPAGFMSICAGSCDIPLAWLAVEGVYTKNAPGGVAYRCSFRVTEAA